MLWLAGLMGVMAVGAASFVAVPTDEDADDGSEFESYIDEQDRLDLALQDALGMATTSFEAETGEADPEQSKLISQFVGDMADLNTASSDAPAMAESNLSLADFVAEEDLYFEANPEELDLDEQFDTGWSDESQTEQILDYDGAEDDLVLVWDDSAGSEPDLELAMDEENPDFLNVLLEGEAVAQVPAGSGLSLENITLVPSSTAVMMGWEAA